MAFDDQYYGINDLGNGRIDLYLNRKDIIKPINRNLRKALDSLCCWDGPDKASRQSLGWEFYQFDPEPIMKRFGFIKDNDKVTIGNRPFTELELLKDMVKEGY